MCFLAYLAFRTKRGSICATQAHEWHVRRAQMHDGTTRGSSGSVRGAHVRNSLAPVTYALGRAVALALRLLDAVAVRLEGLVARGVDLLLHPRDLEHTTRRSSDGERVPRAGDRTTNHSVWPHPVTSTGVPGLRYTTHTQHTATRAQQRVDVRLVSTGQRTGRVT